LLELKSSLQVPYETPRALETHELPGVVADFTNAAKNAISCGFDGIELHAGVCVCVCTCQTLISCFRSQGLPDYQSLQY